MGAELVSRLVEKADADGLHALFLLTTTAADYFPRSDQILDMHRRGASRTLS
ncbi:hypothetical protein P2318_17125 [Myxococcaceae bacterium GXIMD 01537]